MIRVLVADDHALVRAGLVALLRGLPGVEVVAEAGDGREAVTLAAQKRPDVALLDVAMPGLNGLDATARIRREAPTVRVVILSMHATEAYALEALRAGASGYVLKGAPPAELEMALQAVMRGETFLSPAMSRHLVEDFRRRAGGEAGAGPTLTPRQREILQLIAEGQTTKEIARRLSISVKTVETHRAQLMERLGIHDLAGLVRYAIRTGLVSPER